MIYYNYSDIKILMKSDVFRRFPPFVYTGGPKALSLQWATSGLLIWRWTVFLSIFVALVRSCQEWRNGCRIVVDILHNTCLRDKTMRHWPNKHKDLVVMASCMAVFFSCITSFFFFSFSITPQSKFILSRHVVKTGMAELSDRKVYSWYLSTLSTSHWKKWWK